MQKENKKQTNRKKSIIILITVMALIGIIIGSIVIRNVVVNQKTEGESYLAGENAGSSLMASYIRKGVTIGGITGTLESLDTSDATAKPEDILEGKTAYVNGVKITGTMKEKVNMEQLIQNAAMQLEVMLIAKNIRLETNIEKDIFITGDPYWLSEALLNIIKNACEHSKQNDSIKIKAKNTPMYTELIIEDEGEGIDKKDLPHIFKRFYRSRFSSFAKCTSRNCSGLFS